MLIEKEMWEWLEFKFNNCVVEKKSKMISNEEEKM